MRRGRRAPGHQAEAADPAAETMMPGRGGGDSRPATVVLGDLVLDIVLRPERHLEPGSDVPGWVQLRQGGSAASTARWLARLGARSTFITVIGRDRIGRILRRSLEEDHVSVRAVRIAGRRTARLGAIVEPDGERLFVTERAAADELRPEDLRARWFEGARLLHLTAYSLLAHPVAEAAIRATSLARAAGAVVSLDLSSSAPLLAAGPARVEAVIREIGPDLLFGNSQEADALLVGRPAEALLDLAPVAVVKRGGHGATVLARAATAANRVDVATRPLAVPDSTGAGDAFDAGFCLSWIGGLTRVRPVDEALREAARAGHRLAARHLAETRPDLDLGR